MAITFIDYFFAYLLFTIDAFIMLFAAFLHLFF